MPNAFYFHHGWRFRLANRFPLENAFNGVGELPLHPGAARYFAEVNALPAQ